MQRTPRTRSRSGRLVITAVIGLGILGSTTSAEQRKPKKPIQPMVSIDNEGPIAVIRPARIWDGDHERQANPAGPDLLPWRSVIRLDLILPIRLAPWPSAPPRHRP